MPRRLTPISLSTGSGGINRFEAQAKKNQTADAQNIIATEGDVRRRDAFVAIGHAVPFVLPQGTVRAYVLRTGALTPTEIVGPTGFTSPTLVTGGGASFRGILVGNIRGQFDGARLAHLSEPFAGAGRVKIQAQYLATGEVWTDMWCLDQTTAVTANGEVVPLVESGGTISWHTPRIRATWTAQDVGGVVGWWVRFLIQDEAGVSVDYPAPDAPNNVTLYQPGVECFELAPITALSETFYRNRRALMVGSDRRPHGSENGSGLGLWRKPKVPPETLGLSQGWHSAQVELGDFPRWTKDGVAVGAVVPFGSSFHVFVMDSEFVTDRSGIMWPAAFAGLDPDEADCTTTRIEIPGNLLPFPRSEREHDGWILRVTSITGAGPGNGSYRQVWRSERDVDNTVLMVWPPFEATPDADTRFELRRPGCRLRLQQQRHEAFPVGYGNSFMGSDSGIIVEPAPEWERSLYNAPDYDGPQAAAHIDAMTPARWSIDSGDEWVMVNDPQTKRLYLTNGRSGLLHWDGDRLVRADADTESDLALLAAGADPSKNPRLQSNVQAVGSTLDREPPRPRYLAAFANSLICANLPDGPQRIQRSLAYSFDIWVLSDVNAVPDISGRMITGMRALHDRLYVWTPTAIFAFGGDFAINPDVVSPSMGFSNNRGVITVTLDGQPALVGPSADGIRLTNGVNILPILDDWRRIFPGGINAHRLSEASGVYWADHELAIWALPGAGTNLNTDILVWSVARKTFWRWSYDLGISSLALWTDGSGQQRVVAGTQDGHIVTIIDAPDDDGRPIVGRMRSISVEPAEGAEITVTCLHLVLNALGTQPVDVRLFLDGKGRPHHDGILYSDSGDTVLPSTVASGAVPVATDAPLASVHDRTGRVNVRPGATGHQIQYEVSGSSRWRLSAAYCEVRPMSSRGRR